MAGEPRPPEGQRAEGVGASLLFLARRLLEWTTRPLRKRWNSTEPLDAYSLVHMASAAGDTLVAIALADSVFFALKPDEARVHVALYLGLTMAPLAVAAPLLVPLLDRGGFRRAISFAASGGRMLVAAIAASHATDLLLFPLAFILLVLSKVHGITKNGLTLAYAPSEEGLVLANARLGRLAAVGAALATLPGILALKAAGSGSALVLAAAVYGVAVLLNLRLPQPPPRPAPGEVGRLGRVPSLATAAAGTAALRGAGGFLLLLLAFALRRSGQPIWWFGVLAAAATAGSVTGDFVAPRLPQRVREEVVVFGALAAAGVELELVDGAEAVRRYPVLSVPAGDRVLLEPGAGVVDAEGAVRAFAPPLRQIVGLLGRRIARAQAEAVHEAGGIPVDLAARAGAVFRADPGTLSYDGLHPSADGYRVWAHALYPAVAEAAGVVSH